MVMPNRSTAAEDLADPLFRILRPVRQTVPVIVSSPHSGSHYLPEFLAASRLDSVALRRSEDCFVDELFAGAISLGIPLLVADFPRAYCDVNREAWELDPLLFAEKLPPWCNSRTARVGAGFGTIARLVASGEPIYDKKLGLAEAHARIETHWHPYHGALAGLIDQTRTTRGLCVLLDCHSMPGDEAGKGHNPKDPQFVLGDAYGTSCDPMLTSVAQRFLEQNGFRVRRNDPYAGGYVTRHYGQPRKGIHTLQIEISRGLYMNQRDYSRLPEFDPLKSLMTALLECVADASLTLAVPS